MLLRLVLSLVTFLFVDVVFAGVSDAPRKSEFEKALKVIVTTVAPHWPAAEADRIIKAYEDAQANKAFAIEPIYGKSFRSQRHERLEEASEGVLEACQLRYGKPCALIAINEEVVLDGPLVPKDMPRLRYRGKFDLAQMPIIRSAVRTRPDLRGYDVMPEPKVIVIHPWGLVYVSHGDTTLKEVEEKTLAKCNEDPDRNGKDGGCFIYAINNDVVLANRMMMASGGSSKR
jgi:hypothetical protein